MRAHDCEAYRVEGASDHVHLAVRLGRSVTVSKLVEELKTSSSKWLKARFDGMSEFAWQRGYGVFSVGVSQVDDLLAYVDGQADYHKLVSFKDEYQQLLEQCGIAFDERYVFD